MMLMKMIYEAPLAELINLAVPSQILEASPNIPSTPVDDEFNWL